MKEEIKENENMYMVKQFEFVLKINNHIICQRFFPVKNYNDSFRESLELKEMMSDIIGTDGNLTLGLIPEFLKFQCLNNSFKMFDENPTIQQSSTSNKKYVFSFDIIKNNVKKLRNKQIDFGVNDLEKEVIASGSFDGKLFHPNVRFDVDIRSIIPDIIKVMQKTMSLKRYTKMYDSVNLNRKNKLSSYDLERIKQY